MEFCEKLQVLRKQKNLTQEELAAALFVSRTAVSKWESGRGYPSIDSLKAIAKFFSVTIDDLLSGEELLTIAEDDSRQKSARIINLVFAILDISCALLFLMPLFGQNVQGTVQAVSLIALSHTAPYLKILYWIFTSVLVLRGIISKVFPNRAVSFVLTAACALLFIISRQPYAAAFLFVFLIIKALILIKKQ